MRRLWIPLLAPHPFASFSPTEFKQHVESLYIAPLVPAPLAEYAVRLNARGNPVITVRREPKFITFGEVELIATELGLLRQAVWMLLIERGIPIKYPSGKLSDVLSKQQQLKQACQRKPAARKSRKKEKANDQTASGTPPAIPSGSPDPC